MTANIFLMSSFSFSVRRIDGVVVLLLLPRPPLFLQRPLRVLLNPPPRPLPLLSWRQN